MEAVQNRRALSLQVHALLVSGGLNAALPGVMMRSQSASAMLQPQLAPLAARQAAAILNKVAQRRPSASVPDYVSPDSAASAGRVKACALMP